MSISIKSAREIEIMREAGRIVANALQEVRERIEPGMTTLDLDQIAERSIRRQGGEPAFQYINDFPGTLCISVNNEVVHGIPGQRVLRAGDLVKLDGGAIYQGYHGDAAVTVPVGTVTAEARRLLDATEEALARGLDAARVDGFLNDIGTAIDDYISPLGFGIVRQYVGHGIGRELHEAPNVAHFRQANRGVRLRPGMVFTIEPMINAGVAATMTLADGWTVVTQDGRLSAQFEHTVAITADGPDILTIPDGENAWSIPFPVANKVQ